MSSSTRPPAWHSSPDDSQQTSPPRQVTVPAREQPSGIDAIGVQLERIKPLLRGVRRHWTFGLWGLLLAGLAVGYVTYRFQPKYRSETVIYHQAAMSSERVTGQAPGMADPNLLRELLLRHGRLEGLIDELGMYKDTVAKVGKVAAVEELKKRITFEPMGRSTFQIGFVGDSAEEAQDVAARLASSLIDDEQERRREQAKKSAAFLEEEVTRTTAELRLEEQALERFISDHPEFAATALKRPVLAPAPAKPAPAKAAAPAPAAAPRPRGPRVAPSAAPPAPAPRPPPKPPDPALVAARDAALNDLAAATRKLTQLQSSYTDIHPEVVAAKSRVEAAEARVRDATKALQAASADDVYNDAVEPEPPPPAPAPAPVPRPLPRPKKKAAPKDEPVEPEPTKAPDPEPDAASDTASMETEWTRLTRAVDEARDRAERLDQELYRARIAARSQVAGHDAQVVVLDEAYLPATPLRSRSFFVKAGVPFALLVALALALLRALLDDRIYEADDLVHRGLDPILSVVPALGAPKDG